MIRAASSNEEKEGFDSLQWTSDQARAEHFCQQQERTWTHSQIHSSSKQLQASSTSHPVAYPDSSSLSIFSAPLMSACQCQCQWSDCPICISSSGLGRDITSVSAQSAGAAQ